VVEEADADLRTLPSDWPAAMSRALEGAKRSRLGPRRWPALRGEQGRLMRRTGLEAGDRSVRAPRDGSEGAAGTRRHGREAGRRQADKECGR
jgi:hypothetical protein